MSAEFASAIEQAALVAENWVSPLRPGSDSRLLGHLEAGKEIASAIRQLTAAPAAPCPCGDNDGLWCSLPGCPYPKQPSIFLASDPPPSQHLRADVLEEAAKIAEAKAYGDRSCIDGERLIRSVHDGLCASIASEIRASIKRRPQTKRANLNKTYIKTAGFERHGNIPRTCGERVLAPLRLTHVVASADQTPCEVIPSSSNATLCSVEKRARSTLGVSGISGFIVAIQTTLRVIRLATASSGVYRAARRLSIAVRSVSNSPEERTGRFMNATFLSVQAVTRISPQSLPPSTSEGDNRLNLPSYNEESIPATASISRVDDDGSENKQRLIERVSRARSALEGVTSISEKTGAIANAFDVASEAVGSLLSHSPVPQEEVIVSVDGPYLRAEAIQHLRQAASYVFAEEHHGETLDAIGEFRVNVDNAPTAITLLDGSVSGNSGDHVAFRNYARARTSPSRREAGDVAYMERSAKKETPDAPQPHRGGH